MCRLLQLLARSQLQILTWALERTPAQAAARLVPEVAARALPAQVFPAQGPLVRALPAQGPLVRGPLVRALPAQVFPARVLPARALLVRGPLVRA
ncbi:MAG: hypothetical protein ACFBSF_00615, partial [Leptolyngbyaceae cyanobacterium]